MLRVLSIFCSTVSGSRCTSDDERVCAESITGAKKAAKKSIKAVKRLINGRKVTHLILFSLLDSFIFSIFCTFAAEMKLIFDIGNTISKFFLFDGDTLRAHGSEVGHSLSIVSQLLDGTAPEVDAPLCPEAAIISSVVDLSAEAEEQLRRLPCPRSPWARRCCW